jgi:putative ABC transport system permease protein
VTREVAQTQLDGIAHQLAAAFPENRDWRVAARSYQEVIVGSSRVGLLVLFGAVGVVLLIACGNVASLMLARATARQGEIAVRVALGADRGRIVRQLLTESLLYGLMGGSAGVGVALLIISAVRQVSSGILPRVAEVQLDGTALAFTLALSVVTSIVFGLAPAMHAVRGGVAAAMRAGVNISSGRRSLQFRDLLVVGQVALSLTLLVGAGLLLRSLWRLERVELGLDPEHLLTAEIVLPVSESRSRAATLQFWSSFLERVRAIPGVTSAAGTSLLPLDGGGDTYYHVVGETPATPADQRNATLSSVTAGYFETMRIPVLAGRAIAVTDGDDAPPVVVINRSMARRIFRGEQPLGRRLVVDFGEPVTAEIIGVVGDVRVYGPENDPPDIMYFSQRMKGGWGLGYFRPVVRINGDPNALVAPVRAALRELDPSVPLSSARPMEQVVGDAVARERFRARILAGFAGVALLLALLGLYGVLAYTVTQRRREIGIRIALGAGSGAVFSLVVRQGMSLVLAGVALGLLASFGATRALRSLLFEVGQADPAVLGAVIGALAISALAACAFPALRATRVDPMSSLRAD